MINTIIALLYRKIFLILASLLIIAGVSIVIITVNTTHAASSTACPSTISYGSSGSLVQQLQNALNKQENAGLATDGQFGPLTRQAVRNYQSAHGLKVDGIVGNHTWGSLGFCGSSGSSSNGSGGGSNITFTNLNNKPGNGTCVSTRLGLRSSGSWVSTLQGALNKVGVQPQLSPDGDFGPKTEDAVIAYQYATGISHDGNVGPQTWGQLGFNWQSDCGGGNGGGSGTGGGTSCPSGQTLIQGVCAPSGEFPSGNCAEGHVAGNGAYICDQPATSGSGGRVKYN